MKVQQLELNMLSNRFDGLPLQPSSGKCERCGRPLTDPVSVAIGMGPICAGKAGRITGEIEMENERYADDFLNLPIDPYGVVCQRIGPRMLPGSKVKTNVPHLFHHGSPDGYEWGYGGSGPNDFAWNIAEWFLRHLGYKGPTERVFSGHQVSLLSRRFKREVLVRWIAAMPDEGRHIPYNELETFFHSELQHFEQHGRLSWESESSGVVYAEEEHYV